MKQKILITFLFLSLGILILLLPKGGGFYYHRFFLLSVIPILYFGYALLFEEETSVQFIPSDISFFAFVGIGFFSFFWAINGALVWCNAFEWLVFILWMLIARKLSSKQIIQIYLPRFFLIYFLITIAHHILAISLGVSLGSNWNLFFGGNNNYTSSLLVSLFPFLLFYRLEKQCFFLLKFLCTICILYILVFVTYTRGVLIAFFFVLFYYAWSYYPKKYFQYLIGTFILLSLIIGGVLFCYLDNISMTPLLREFGRVGDTTRLYMMDSSIKIFLENPLIGIGLGNWQIEAYKYNLNNVSGYNNPFTFLRFGNHNLYSKYLAELGLIGILVFFSAIGSVLRLGWKRQANLTSLQKAAYASFVTYLITSFIYLDINSYEFYYSGVQFLAFFCLGLLTHLSVK